MTGVTLGLARKVGETWGNLRTEQLAALPGHGRRLARFGSVGLTGVLVNYVVLYLLAEAGGINPVLAGAFATEAAILSNFTFNHRWTFKDLHSREPWWKLAVRYNLFALGGLALSVAVLAVLTYLLGLDYLFANLFAIGAATLWNYAANYRWTWSPTKSEAPLNLAAHSEDEYA